MVLTISSTGLESSRGAQHAAVKKTLKESDKAFLQSSPPLTSASYTMKGKTSSHTSTCMKEQEDSSVHQA